MNDSLLNGKIDTLLADIKAYIETQSLSETEVFVLKDEIDKILYECLYFRMKLFN